MLVIELISPELFN